MGVWIFKCSLLTFLGSASAFAGTDCGRTCPREILDQHLNAILKRDPSVAPLFEGSPVPDNAVTVKPGNSVWKTFTPRGKIQRRYMRLVNQSTGYLGTPQEGSNNG